MTAATESLMVEQGAEAAGSAANRLRVVNLGISSSEICGVRDYARVVGQALAEQGVDASMHWCDTVPRPFRRKRRDVRRWLDELAALVEASRPDALILHYSVFEYGVRGFPIFAPLVARALAATEVPVVGVLHEFVYPFGRRGWRGAAQAAAHRAVLPTTVRRCAAVIVTTEQRVRYLRFRPWLPRRPVAFVPVCSNLPNSATGSRHRDGPLELGILGFGSEEAEIRIVADAVRLLRRGGRRLTVRMLGAPGSESAAARRWRSALHGDARGLQFTGLLDAGALADAIVSADVVLIPDRAGADSRRGLLAAGLAAGKPVVTFDGPEFWERAVSAGAVRVVPPVANALADAIALLVDDPSERARQEGRAADFYAVSMSPSIVAAALDSAVRRVAGVVS